MLLAAAQRSGSEESGGLALSSNGTVFCWGMCNYGGQAFDPGFPSGLNCPHIELNSVSLGTPLYSAALSCAPLWNSKHPLLKSKACPWSSAVRRNSPVCPDICGDEERYDARSFFHLQQPPPPQQSRFITQTFSFFSYKGFFCLKVNIQELNAHLLIRFFCEGLYLANYIRITIIRISITSI